VANAVIGAVGPELRPGDPVFLACVAVADELRQGFGDPVCNDSAPGFDEYDLS